jgi:hypothetical protein
VTRKSQRIFSENPALPGKSESVPDRGNEAPSGYMCFFVDCRRDGISQSCRTERPSNSGWQQPWKTQRATQE